MDTDSKARDARSRHTRKDTTMNNATISSRPISATRMPHYYQGRPNVVFLDRYNTQVNHSPVRRT